MNNRKVALLSVMVMGVFVLSALGNSAMYSNTTAQAIVTNFDLVVETNVGNRRRESFALYLRQALTPLGIDVEVLGKPFNQFVGDLLRFTANVWDISIVGFVGGSPYAPDFTDLYACGGFFGTLTYALCDPFWQENFETRQAARESPLAQTQDDVDALVIAIQRNLDMESRYEQTLLFQQMFMEELLYDYPLLAATGIIGVWDGFVGYDPDEGFLTSSFRGAHWDYDAFPTLEDRDNGEKDLAFSIGSLDSVFNPLLGASNPQTQAEANLFPQLTMSDKGFRIHPNVAVQVERLDWEGAPTLNSACVATELVVRECSPVTGGESNNTIELGRYKLLMPTPDNTASGGILEGVDVRYWIDPVTQETTQPIRPSDFALTWSLYMSNDHVQINGMSFFDAVWKVDANDSSGELNIYIYIPTLDDVSILGFVQAIPHYLLGGELTIPSSSDKTYATPLWAPADTTGLVDPTTLSLNAIFQTEEFIQFGLNPIQGGQYYVDFSNNSMYAPGEVLIKKANPHYWFPNELRDSPGGNFNLNDESYGGYFFNWDGFDPENPKFTVETIIMPIIEDLSADLILFRSGTIDANAPSMFGGAEIQAQTNDPRFRVHTFLTSATADLLMFNLLNPNLVNYDIRRAIAHAVNKAELQVIVDGLQEPQDSPVKTLFKLSGWYSDEWKIDYDLDAARTLMLQNDYVIPGYTLGAGGELVKVTLDQAGGVGGDVFDDIRAIGSGLFMLIAALAAVFTTIVYRKRRV
jgi:hypothetical protein